MQEPSDIELLRQYAEQDSEAAFETLVSRHVNLVYSAALRKTGNFHAAEEVAQAVFIILAQKARTLRKGTILSGWLYQAARLTAANFLRSEIRRARREQEADMPLHPNEPEIWPQIVPLLEDAMGRLNEKDRNAVVLRFFEGKSFHEIGAACGGTENAAKKRVAYALEKLRAFFTKHGVQSTTAAIAGAISANSLQAAPAGLAKSISAAAIAKGATASASTLTLAKGALKIMAWSKTKITITAAAVVLLAAGTGVATWHAARAIETRVGLTKMQGSWEGTLPVGQQKLRMVLKIGKTNDTFYALLDSIDQGTKNIPFPEISATSHSLHIALPARDIDYDATLSSDGTELSGKFVQMQSSFRLKLARTATPDTVLEMTPDQYAPRQDSDLQGQWQGTLMDRSTIYHLNLRIAELSPGVFLAQMDSIDQGALNVPVTAITYEKPELRFQIASIDCNFVGKVNYADDRIVGTWTLQHSKGSLTFARVQTGAIAAIEAKKDYGDGSPNQIQGHWKGQIPINGVTFHLGFNIALMPDGSYTATLDSPDQGVRGYSANSADCSFPNVKLAWKSDDASYVGKMNHGKLSGTWTQGKVSVPLDFQKDVAE
jgi:RNA polymerase sigma factor (sigma-70 family)